MATLGLRELHGRLDCHPRRYRAGRGIGPRIFRIRRGVDLHACREPLHERADRSPAVAGRRYDHHYSADSGAIRHADRREVALMAAGFIDRRPARDMGAGRDESARDALDDCRVDRADAGAVDVGLALSRTDHCGGHDIRRRGFRFFQRRGAGRRATPRTVLAARCRQGPHYARQHHSAVCDFQFDQHPSAISSAACGRAPSSGLRSPSDRPTPSGSGWARTCSGSPVRRRSGESATR